MVCFIPHYFTPLFILLFQQIQKKKKMTLPRNVIPSKNILAICFQKEFGLFKKDGILFGKDRILFCPIISHIFMIVARYSPTPFG